MLCIIINNQYCKQLIFSFKVHITWLKTFSATASLVHLFEVFLCTSLLYFPIRLMVMSEGFHGGCGPGCGMHSKCEGPHIHPDPFLRLSLALPWLDRHILAHISPKNFSYYLSMANGGSFQTVTERREWCNAWCNGYIFQSINRIETNAKLKYYIGLVKQQ